MKTLVVFTLLEQELTLELGNLEESVKNITTYFQSSFSLLFIIQGDRVSLPRFIEKITNKEVIFIKESCLSKARNTGLEFLVNKDFSHILFHDSRITLGTSFCTFISQPTHESNHVKSGKVIWKSPHTTTMTGKIKKVKPNIFKNTYIGSYHLPIALIKELKFNEKVGPGKTTTLKAGEDVLFLEAFLRQNNTTFVIEAKNALIFHPPRDNEKKRIEYAQGQGALFRYFIENGRFSYGINTYFLLFGINSILLLLSLRTYNYEIFKRRLKGFVSNDYKSFIGEKC